MLLGELRDNVVNDVADMDVVVAAVDSKSELPPAVTGGVIVTMALVVLVAEL